MVRHSLYQRREHLLLHRLETDERIELGLQFLEAARVRRRPPRVEPLEPLGLGALSHLLPQHVQPEQEVLKRVRHQARRTHPCKRKAQRPTRA